MPFLLRLSSALQKQGWKVKIRDNECREPPHITIIFKTRCWRWGLREEAFLDRVPPGREVPPAVIEAIQSQLGQIIAAWDLMFPENKVRS